METDGPHTTGTSSDTLAPASPSEAPTAAAETTVTHRDLAEWHGKQLIDRNGERIGKLEDVYIDTEIDEPQFATVKEGFFGPHLTFVPLTELTIGPDNLQVSVTKQQVKDAPNIQLEGDELSQADESALYHHYQLNYTPSDTPSGRRLARR